MPKPVSQLLDNRLTSTDKFVQMAEELSSYPSEDVRLMSDLANAARSVLSQLNLDPSDTTAGELYHALLVEYKNASDNFSRQIGEKAADSAAKRLKRVAQIIVRGHTHRQVWVLKKTVAKRLLKDHQPKKLMKELHYRSLDSMLKSENVALIYAAMAYTESPRWLKLMQKSYAALSSKDFETREIEFIAPTTARWASVSTKSPSISRSNELGAIVFWPNQQAYQITSLGLSILGLQVADELCSNSAWLKLHQFHPGFSKFLVAGTKPRLKITDGQTVAWGAVARAFTKRAEADFSDSFESHLEKADLNRRTPSDLLSSSTPHLNLWPNCEYLIFSDSDGQLVSCSLADTAKNYANKNPLQKHVRLAAAKMLEEQLVGRYLAHPGFERYILRVMENSASGGTDNFVNIVNFSKFGAATNNPVRLV